MPELKQQLRDDLTTAMKARDSLRSSTLRMALTAVTNAEVAGKEAKELSDGEVVEVLGKETKKRREAAEAFEEAGRGEQAQKERDEAGILATYLPEQLSDDELSAIVAEAIASTGAGEDGMRAMGKVMGSVQPQVKGLADGSAVAAEVKRQLGG